MKILKIEEAINNEKIKKYKEIRKYLRIQKVDWKLEAKILDKLERMGLVEIPRKEEYEKMSKIFDEIFRGAK